MPMEVTLELSMSAVLSVLVVGRATYAAMAHFLDRGSMGKILRRDGVFGWERIYKGDRIAHQVDQNHIVISSRTQILQFT